MSRISSPSNQNIPFHLCELIRGQVNYTQQLRILGLISYLVDDDPEEHFFKVDISYGPPDISVKPRSCRPVAEQDSVISTNCPTPGSNGDHQACSSSSSSETELTRVIHSSPTVSILSTLPPKTRTRPYPRYTLNTLDSTFNEDDWPECGNISRNRRDRRKSRKPRRQLLPSTNNSPREQPIFYQAEAFSPPIIGFPSPDPIITEEELEEQSPIHDDSLTIALLPSDSKVDSQGHSDESQHNKSSSSPSSGCQLDAVDEDDEKETASTQVGLLINNNFKSTENKAMSTSISGSLALLSQNTYSLLLRGPFTLSATPTIAPNTAAITTTTTTTTTAGEAGRPLKVASTQNFPSQLSTGTSGGGSGKGNYKCRYCDKLFNRKFCRERHERLHTGVKPYTCEVCAEKFIRLEDKKRHLRLNHPGSQHDTLGSPVSLPGTDVS